VTVCCLYPCYLCAATPPVNAQIDSSTSQYKGRSTGLGLAIARLIAAAHCGQLCVTSAPGVGSTFTLRFPTLVGCCESESPSRSGSPDSRLARRSPSAVCAESVQLCDVDLSHVTHAETSRLEDNPSLFERHQSAMSAMSNDSHAGSRFYEHAAGAAQRKTQYLALDNRARPLSSIDTTIQDTCTSSLVSSSVRPLLSILIVDDSAMNARMLTHTLQRSSLSQEYKLRIAHVLDGKAGLEALQYTERASIQGPRTKGADQIGNSGAGIGETPCAHTRANDLNSGSACDAVKVFDIVLSDAEMPVMDGYTMVRLLRQWESRESSSALPIIGITGNALPADVQRFLDAGASVVMLKPVEIADLLAHITSLLPPRF
jgi:CheY-like chemotaxis protein